MFIKRNLKRQKGYSFVSPSKWHLPLFILIVSAPFLQALETSSAEVDASVIAGEIEVIRKAYPDVIFEYSYSPEYSDWEVRVKTGGRISLLYRAGGSYLSEVQMSNRDGYRSFLYNYSGELRDPADFTEEELEWVTRFGSTENRRTGRISSTAFFDAVYDSFTRSDVESHIVNFNFLDRSIMVHEKITGPLRRVESRIRSLAAESDEVDRFVREMGSVSSYAWRQVRDTQGKSFHSMGLAVDILPSDAKGRAIYWNWEKNKGNDLWMLIPLSERWAPPADVVDAFEKEGFTWGGSWPVWDNMHFEYRPELLLWRDR